MLNGNREQEKLPNFQIVLTPPTSVLPAGKAILVDGQGWLLPSLMSSLMGMKEFI
jgi:hypothetical protein